MKRRWHTVTPLIIGIAAITAVVGCSSSGGGSTGSKSAGAKVFHLAGTSGPADDAFWASLRCGGTKAAEAAGATIKWEVLPNGGGNAADEQMDQDAKLGNPNGMIIGYYGTEDYTPIINGFNQSGIPVVEINATTANNYYQSFISPPNTPNVATLARMAAKRADNSGTMIVIAVGTGIPVIAARWEPVVQLLKRIAPGINILPTQYSNNDTQKVDTIVSGLLVAHPDTKIVWTTAGSEAAGAIAAIKAAGRVGKTFVYTYDATPVVVGGIQDGIVGGAISQAPYQMSYQGVTALLNLLKKGGVQKPFNQKANPQNVDVATKILTKSNIASAAAAPYLYKTTCA